MISTYTLCNLALFVFILQFPYGAATNALSIYTDDEDCRPDHYPNWHYSFDDNVLQDNHVPYEEVFDGHRRLIFPKMKNGLSVSLNGSLSGRFIHPFSKYYVINFSLGILNIPKYMRVFIGWVRFLVGLSLKAKTFMFRLMIRMFRLFVEWPLHRAHLILSKGVDLFAVLRYLVHIMFPEWPSYQVDHVFEGYPTGSVSIAAVYKRIFRLTFPEWPEFEVNSIFDGSDSLVVVLERLVHLLFPNWPNTNYVFQGSPTITVVLKKLLKLLLPSFDLNTIVSNSNSALTIFEKALMIQFPGWPNENTYLIGWTFLKLFLPYYMQVRPELTYYQTVAPSDQNVLDKWLSDLKVDINKEISSSTMDIRKIFLMSFGGTTPGLATKLASLFDALLGEFTGSAPSSPSIVIDTSNVFSNIKIGGSVLTSPTWNTMFPEVPIINDLPAPPTMTPRPIVPADGSGLHGGLDLQAMWSSIMELPVQQTGASGPNSFCREPGANYMTIPFNAWVQHLGPVDDVLRLLSIGAPGFDMSTLKSEYAVPESLTKLLFNWPQYQDKLTMYGKIPVTHAIKFFLPALLYNWPKYYVMPVVHNTNSIRVMVQRILERMFATWKPFLQDSVTPVHLIFKRLLLLILPDIPKSDLRTIFEGNMNLADILQRLFKVFFPHWPQMELGYIPKHIDPKVVHNLLTIIFNWPKYEAMLEVNSAAALSAAIRKLVLLLVPKVPAHELEMVVFNKVGLSLLISRFINILNPAHVIPLDVNVHDEHTLAVPYWAFDILFYNWPYYEADLNDKELQTSPAFSRCLNWLRSQIAGILHRASCSDPIVYAWVGELASALLEYSIETLPSVYEEGRGSFQ